MDKLPMCRICLAENVRMHLVINRNLQELYEKLTDIPFITEDSRPILACFFCFAKLKQCYRLLRQCLVAEDLFAQRMNEDYEPNPLINQNHLESYGGFIKCPIQCISINDDCQKERIAIKEELPERLDDIIEPKEEHQSDELEPNLDNSCLTVADVPPHHSESDLGDAKPIMGFKIEVEVESEKKRIAREMKRMTVAKKPKLDTGRTKLEDAITAEQTNKEKSDSKVIRTTPDQRRFNRVKKIKQLTQIGEKSKCDVNQRSFSYKGDLTKHIQIIPSGENPYKCDVCQRSFSDKGYLTKHIRIHTGEKPYKCYVCQRSFSNTSYLSRHIRIHTGEKPYKCDICQHSFGQKSILTNHIRQHTGEKPYKCKVCQRCFTKNSNLTDHIRIHTREKPHKCDVCQRSFSQKGVLTKHIRTHTGEKPYMCNICQRCFSQKIHLSKHIRIIHNGENP